MTVPAQILREKPAPQPKRGWVRVAIFVVAILAIQLGFILSYVGAFHAPEPHRLKVQVVAPSAIASQIVERLNDIPGEPLSASVAADADSANAALERNDTSGIFTVNAAGTEDALTVASAGGASISSALRTIFERMEASQSRTVAVTDALPVQKGDGRGLTGFYLVTGWLVGGYLMAAVLGILLGTTFAGVRAALLRLSIFVPYAALSGIGGALVVESLGALNGHFWPVALVGMLVVLAGATVTVALQSFLGIIGIGISIVIFVVLGNPSAGGAYQAELLPPFWSGISAILPNGAATSALRNVVYFDGAQVPGELLVVAVWTVAGILATFLSAAIKGRRRSLRS